MNPPIAMIDAPVLSSRLLAPIEPTVAAAQRLSRPCTSSASAAFSAIRPPGPPGRPDLPPERRRARRCSGPTSRSARCGRLRPSRRRMRRAPPRRTESPPLPAPRLPDHAAVHRPRAPTPRPPIRPARSTAARAASPECGPAGRTPRRPSPPTSPPARDATTGVPDAPQFAHRNSHQRGDCRGQGHGVVRVDDAVHEAEHCGGHQQPATPQQQARTKLISPWRPYGSTTGRQPDRSAPPAAARKPRCPSTARTSGRCPARRRRRRCPLRQAARATAGGPLAGSPGTRRPRCGQSRCSPTPAAAGC